VTQHALRVPGPVVQGLTEIAEEFKRLDLKRRNGGLSLGEAERYNALFANLSDVLASGERHRKADVRQFLRVRSGMELVIRTGKSEERAACIDFGGGGCGIVTARQWRCGDDVWLDGAMVNGERLPLHGRAVIVWARLPTREANQQGYGLRFAIDGPEMRDQIDRLLYRVLDLFLRDGDERVVSALRLAR
jgi:hypothetical protein